MKKYLLLLILLPVILPAQTITPIANIQDSIDVYNGQSVTIQGVITIGAGVTYASLLNAYIQDDSDRGILLFDFDITAAYEQDLVRGNELQVSGTIEEYQGTTELTDFNYTVLQQNQPLPVVSLSIPDAQDYLFWEATLIQVYGELTEDPYYAGGGYNINIEDENGETISLRIWDSTGIDIAYLEEGIPIFAQGIVDSYNDESQILPGYQEDILIDIPLPVIENISSSPDNPYFDEEITVSAEVIDFDGNIIETNLFYRLENEETYLDTIFMENTNGDNYQAILPPLETHTEEIQRYVVKIQAKDDSANVVYSNEHPIEIFDKAPIISNITITNTPEPMDTLWVKATIEDLDGEVIETKLLYTIDFKPEIYETELDSIDVHLYRGYILGRSSGTTIHVGAYAKVDSSLTTIEYDLAQYTFPVYSHSAILDVPAKAFNPYAGETFPIKFASEKDDKAVLRIYNSEGKMITTFQNLIISAEDGINEVEWDGRDKNNELQDLGLYILYLEVTDVNNGNKKTAKAPIVIGAPLK